MPASRLSKEKRVLVLAALTEGTPIRAVCRMSKTGKNTIKRVIEETGEALAVYMMKNFRDLCCQRVQMDEQWQYVGMHGQRMTAKEEGRGDFWLWAAIDPDTKLIFSYQIGRRDWQTAERFVEDVAKRVVNRPVQITTDANRSYAGPIRAYFGYEGVNYGTETKVFGALDTFRPELYASRRKLGVPRVSKCTREAVMGNPDMSLATTAHIERAFLTVRQEIARFTRCTLAYSKDLRMHKLATHLHMGIYNLCRKHHSLDGFTPAQAAGVEEERWSLEKVVEMTDAYLQTKQETAFGNLLF